MRQLFKKICLTVGLGVLVWPLTVWGQINPSVLADSCAGCHGTDGKSPGSIPMLRGKSVSFIEQALKDFKTDQKQATVMNRLAKGLSDEQIAAVAQRLGGKK